MKNIVQLRRIISIISVLVPVLTMPANASTVNIFSGSSPIFAPVFIADTLGYFSDEGLDVDVKAFTSGAEATEGFRAGSAQFLVAADVPMLYLLAGGDARMVAQFSANPDMLLVIGNQDMKGPEDLVGKKIGLVRKSASEFLLYKHLSKAGVSLSDVELVNIAPFEQVSALTNGDVDALSSWKPFDNKIAALSGNKFHTLSWNGNDGYILYSGLVVKSDYFAENPDTVEKVVRALTKAANWLSNAAPEEVSKTLSMYLKNSPDDVSHVIANNTWDVNVNEDVITMMKEIEDFLVSLDLIKNRIDWDSAIDTSFMK
ncbi:MAG: aliphatic sulfonate ABC transporter substrate-binding protein [marine bacterium B5-7]|nr:MAG: aliphatic sulfonate ABC transporter substrate-binding protein [marine bacterium B5-7]